MIDGFLLSEAGRVAILSLSEDHAWNDAATVAMGACGELAGVCEFRARETLVIAGWFAVEAVFRVLGGGVMVERTLPEGVRVEAGDVIGVLRGPVGAILRGERSALNILCRLCGIATITAGFVAAAGGVEILDTRKTTPGLRALEKYAVRAGGGVNHRMNLSEMAMFKDNHIAALGGIAALNPALEAARSTGVPIEVEVDSLQQLSAALRLNPDRILLDNMSLSQLEEAVEIVGGRCYLEASGGVTLATVASIARTGVNGISVGALTHSAPAVDIGLDWREGPGVPARG